MSIYLTIILALLLSAFFSGMEIAFVSSSKLRFELDHREGGALTKLLAMFYNHKDQFITTMVIGNNIVLVIYSMEIAELLEPHITSWCPNPIVLVLIQTIVATIIVLFIGEFIPKTIFRGSPNMWIKIFSPLLLLFYVILFPIAKFTSLISWLTLKLFHIKTEHSDNNGELHKIDLDYLITDTLDQAKSQDEIDNDVRIFHNALDFSSVRLKDCIVPRTEIVALDLNDAKLEDLTQAFICTGFSKILIYNNSIDNIIGYVHSSDLFQNHGDWRESLRQIPIVPETMAASKLMSEFMQTHKSIAVVLDEFGGTAGIVTLEDIMEEIFGEIEDEHDVQNIMMKQISENEYLLSGRAEIDAVNEAFELGIPESDDYITIAGYILHNYEKFPKLNELINISNYKFQIQQATNNRIELVKLTLEKKK